MAPFVPSIRDHQTPCRIGRIVALPLTWSAMPRACPLPPQCKESSVSSLATILFVGPPPLAYGQCPAIPIARCPKSGAKEKKKHSVVNNVFNSLSQRINDDDDQGFRERWGRKKEENKLFAPGRSILGCIPCGCRFSKFILSMKRLLVWVTCNVTFLLIQSP